ncbi:MAG TPA: GNAT family N-acetyltransferase [Candidatus Methylomirabilis sp.]|nr:GNAT family N-acetyltransferase [Candidatus Methylomirabilis sp.]
MLPQVIRTERLVLRPWSFADAGDIFLYANDVEWSRYLRIAQPYSLEDARQFIAAQMLLNRQAHHSWAIEHEARVVGGINLRLLSDLRIGVLGYSIARAVWGRGLATEAARAIVDAAFEGCPKFAGVRAMVDARNLASLRVLEKIGMRREGVLRLNRLGNDGLVDEVWCELSRTEWEAERAAGR